MLGNILYGFIIIVVGVNLAPTVANQVQAAKSNTNFSSTDTTLLGLVTTFYVLAVMSVGISILAVGLRNSGLS